MDMGLLCNSGGAGRRHQGYIEESHLALVSSAKVKAEVGTSG